MTRLLSGTALMLCLTLPAQAATFNILTPNPTSATGNFSLSPGAGPFEDQVVFTLIGGPQFVTIANATNTYAASGDEITGWVASILSAGLDQVVNNADDVVLFGPQNAVACGFPTNCQIVGGQGTIDGAGIYYAEFTGTGSGTSGYSGNISTQAVPGPIVGAGLPGLIVACMALLGLVRRRRLQTA